MNEIAKITEKKRAVGSCVKHLEPYIESYGIAAKEKK